jgi:hypothetical protein
MEPSLLKIGDTTKYMTITPDLLLKDVLKKIIKTWNIDTTHDPMFEISFNHPFKGCDDRDKVTYDVTNDSVELLTLAQRWVEYEDIPIGENGIFDLIYGVDVIG